MFKIAKYKDLNGIKKEISFISTTVDDNSFDVLRFYIQGNMGSDVYSFSFDLNTPLNLLHLEDLEFGVKTSFNKYIQLGDEIFGLNGSFDLNPTTDYFIVHTIGNEYLLTVNFKSEEDIAGTFEIEFNIDDYKKEID